jgi:hypothetical protein
MVEVKTKMLITDAFMSSGEDMKLFRSRLAEIKSSLKLSNAHDVPSLTAIDLIEKRIQD